MSISLFSVAIFALFATVLAIEVYKGANKGLLKALITLGTIFVGILASVTATPIVSYLLARLAEKYLLQFLPIYNQYLKLVKQYGSVRELGIALASMVLGLLIFWVMFVVFRVAFGAFFGLIYKLFVHRRKDDVGYCKEKKSAFYRRDRVLGGVVGAFSAVLLTTVMIAPVMGVFDTYDRAYATFEIVGEDLLARVKIDKNEMRNLRKYNDDICGKVFYEMGGKHIYRQLTSSTLYSEKVYLLDELDTIHAATVQVMDTYEAMPNPKTATPEDADKIRALGASIVELKLTKGLLADLVSMSANAWLDGNTVFGVAKPELPSLVSQPFDDMIEICAETNPNSISYNLSTVFNLYALAIDTNLFNVDFTDFESAFKFVNETQIIERINEEISKNRYMKHIRLTSITMAAVAQQLNGDMLSEEEFDKLSGNLAAAINSVNDRGYATPEERVGALSTYAKDYILEAGIDVPDSVVDAVAEELMAEFPEGDITAEDIKNLFDKYAK